MCYVNCELFYYKLWFRRINQKKKNASHSDRLWCRQSVQLTVGRETHSPFIENLGRARARASLPFLLLLRLLRLVNVFFSGRATWLVSAARSQYIKTCPSVVYRVRARSLLHARVSVTLQYIRLILRVFHYYG